MCPRGYYQSVSGPMGTLVPAMCNRTLYAQVHELQWGHWRISNNREGTLLVFLTRYIYYAHLTSLGFDQSVCHESLLTSFVMLLA